MSGALVILLGALSLSPLERYNYTCETSYYNFPKFWTNSGLCPEGKIVHNDIKSSLLSEAMQMNLLYIAALPKGAITHLRIHWLLELMKFTQFTQSGVPIYDFSVLDTFLMNLDDIGIYPVIEFMGNLSEVFIKNPNQNELFWENLSYQVGKHYLNLFGAKKVLNWKFETWNEPDLLTYNILNFTFEDYLTYVQSIRLGLQVAGERPENNLYFPLRGPAGLFKSEIKHPLCWSIMDFCNTYVESCPFDILTYHLKGAGENASDVINNSKILLQKIYDKYPNLFQLPISNDEADPISGWSTPREFQADVRYAVTLINIILDHWQARLANNIFNQLESISHDNAFLSYHPYEFTQRTLLAHFRMNQTNPPHSQFIQKPVYAALGLLSRLADMASDVQIETTNGKQLKVLKTMASGKNPLYFSWLIMPQEGMIYGNQEEIMLHQSNICHNIANGFILESIDQRNSNPYNVWHSFNRPPYPNATIRALMRRQQGPKLHSTGLLNNTTLKLDLGILQPPWIVLLRSCSPLKPGLKTAKNLIPTSVTSNEVLLTWQEFDADSVQCLKTYEVWFKMSNTHSWINISLGWHLPFPSFHFAPLVGISVNGFYKVRAIDVFNNTSPFSTPVQYIEIK